MFHQNHPNAAPVGFINDRSPPEWAVEYADPNAPLGLYKTTAGKRWQPLVIVNDSPPTRAIPGADRSDLVTVQPPTHRNADAVERSVDPPLVRMRKPSHPGFEATLPYRPDPTI